MESEKLFKKNVNKQNCNKLIDTENKLWSLDGREVEGWVKRIKK